MNRSAWKRAGVALTAAAVVTGVAGCQDGGTKAADKPQTQSLEDVTKVIQAAYTKTSAAKSAKIRMTIEMTGAGLGSGTTTMTGVQGWDPAAMDVTMSGGMFASMGAAGMPEKIRMIMRDDVMYMDMGAEQAAGMDGKRWMKMDFAAMAKESGDAALQKQMTQGLGGMNQDPAQQLALLLEAPGIKHVGPEKVEGVEAQHYKGTVAFEDMLNANKSFDGMPKADRDKLVATMKESGIKGYDTELWVNGDGYPVKTVVGMKMPEGTMDMTAFYSDYGTEATVEAPPAKETFDVMEMLGALGQG
ncbi:hypothetical protein [Streptomyces sp. NBC_00094]|uniref:hypothetical protein n=1 Tax=Streptomyces sp. NBC_00094 TaxID=2903620 RepID=UPI00225599BB|nr:hypothetical protein [Streptomyces sp. NBC_00094]MCX5392534.1 hypothetical protein [Streptomyces sp. NBC_00094]